MSPYFKSQITVEYYQKSFRWPKIRLKWSGRCLKVSKTPRMESNAFSLQRPDHTRTDLLDLFNINSLICLK